MYGAYSLDGGIKARHIPPLGQLPFPCYAPFESPVFSEVEAPKHVARTSISQNVRIIPITCPNMSKQLGSVSQYNPALNPEL